MDGLFSELEEMVPRYKIDVIDLYDDCFALKIERLREFCQRMEKLQKEIGRALEWTVQLTVKKINSEVLTLLKNAGCVCVSYGFESFSKSVLGSMRKPISKEEIKRALTLTLEHKLIIRANFIFGDVAETRESYTETLDFWKDSCQGQVNLDAIMLYPGSPIYEGSIKRGVIKDRLSFLENIDNIKPINFTANMSDNEYLYMLQDIFEAKRCYGAFTISRSIEKVDHNYNVAVKCPFCSNKFKCNNIKLTPRFKRLSFGSFHSACGVCKRRFIVMSLLGFTWMKLKSIRYRILKAIHRIIPVRNIHHLSQGLEHAP